MIRVASTASISGLRIYLPVPPYPLFVHDVSRITSSTATIATPRHIAAPEPPESYNEETRGLLHSLARSCAMGYGIEWDAGLLESRTLTLALMALPALALILGVVLDRRRCGFELVDTEMDISDC